MNQSPKLNKKPIFVSARTSIHDSDYLREENIMELSEDSRSEQLTDDSEEEGQEPFNNDRECYDVIYESNVQRNTSTLIAHDELNSSQHNLSNTLQSEQKFQHQSKSNSTYCIFGVIGLLITVITAKLWNVTQEPITISYLQQYYPLQPRESLENIETIIDDVLKFEPIHPAVFLFLYNNENNYHGDFIDAIARFASNKLGVNEEHITVSEQDYVNPEADADYGSLIDRYKPILDVKKVMVIRELQRMPGRTAQALHSFCDEITPLVDRAVYILTLKVPSFQGNEVSIAERVLNKVWNDLENDILAPLITRVTSTVIKIY